MTRVIVTIPAYNEEDCIRSTLKEILDGSHLQGYDLVIHVQDDGSCDRSAEIAESMGCVVDRNPSHLGLAETFRRSVANCIRLRADVIVHIDADGQYDPDKIMEMVRLVESGYDLVIGSRFLNQNTYTGSPYRNSANRAFSRMISLITGIRITDATSGFRAFNGKVASELQLHGRNTYTYEQDIRAAQLGYKICEVQVLTRRTRKSRLIKNMFVYGLRACVDIMGIKLWGKHGITAK